MRLGNRQMRDGMPQRQDLRYRTNLRHRCEQADLSRWLSNDCDVRHGDDLRHGDVHVQDWLWNRRYPLQFRPHLRVWSLSRRLPQTRRVPDGATVQLVDQDLHCRLQLYQLHAYELRSMPYRKGVRQLRRWHEQVCFQLRELFPLRRTRVWLPVHFEFVRELCERAVSTDLYG